MKIINTFCQKNLIISNKIKPFIWCSFLLLLSYSKVLAQLGISKVYSTVISNQGGEIYTGASAPGAQTSNTGTSNKTYYYGMNNNNLVPQARQLQSFQTINSTFTYQMSQVIDMDVYIRRQASPPSNRLNVDLLYYEGIYNNNTNIVNTNYPYIPKMENNFAHRFIGMGTDNLFANDNSSVNHNSIERVDVVIPNGYLIENALASGLAIFERGAATGHDACIIGIITAIDANGKPTAYASTFKNITSSNYYTTQNVYGGDTADYFTVRRNVNTNDRLLISNVIANQGIGGVYMSLSDFNLSNNQTIYGYSILPPDFWSATNATNRAMRALDWTNETYFPSNTTESVGGIDLSMIAGIVKKMIIQGNVYHDNNGLENLAVDGLNIYNPANEQLYVYLIDPNSNAIIAKVAVNQNGSFTIDKTIFGNLSLVLTTNNTGVEGGTWNNNMQTLPSGWGFVGEDFGINNAAGTGINNGLGTGNNSLATLKDGKINVTFTDQDITNIAFGIQQLPTAHPKAYFISNSNFAFGAPSSIFPNLNNYKFLEMNSASLIETNNGSNGSLTGTDPEDCATNNCNGNAGGVSSTFKIGFINSNTKLYYNFGTEINDVKEVIANSPTAIIKAFDINKMVIYASGGAGTPGNEIGFTYALVDNAGSQSSFVNYVIKTPEPLPLKLINFDLLLEKNQVKLLWTTTNEVNVKGFEIEHSTNGSQWKSIGFVESKTLNQNNTVYSNYAFVDAHPLQGKNLYRLKQLDLNGNTEYSLVKNIWLKNDSQIEVYPNPVNDILTINGLEGKERIVLYDMLGKKIMELKSNNTKANINLENMATGIYQLHILDSNEKSNVFKILK